jgi:hypothetical protein
MLVIASTNELARAGRVWGTGGWLPPEEREALDWVTLARWLGWGPRVVGVLESAVDIKGAPADSIVVATDLDSLPGEAATALRARLAEDPVIVVARAGPPDAPVARLAGTWRGSGHATGRRLRWCGPGPERSWECSTPLAVTPMTRLPDVETWATVDDVPAIVVRRFERGVIATLAFHPGHGRDADGAATALIRTLLTEGAQVPVAWLDFTGTLVLRMDDPGGAQNVHSQSWYYRKLGEGAWHELGDVLASRNARLTIGYSSGWVDDGDPGRGDLEVGEAPALRCAGAVHPSPLVRYRDRRGHRPGTLHDYQAEYRGIQTLRRRGVAEVELHGYTHMHPDSVAWARASDRYTAVAWFRELGQAAETALGQRAGAQHPLALAISTLRRFFDVRPAALICPGDAWTDAAMTRALDLGLEMVSSYYHAVRDHDRFCWSQHVCAPYLDEAASVHFASGLPVVGYFHDRDLALHGVAWAARCLDRWHAAGARRLIDLRELAAAVGHRLVVRKSRRALDLVVTPHTRLTLVRPVAVRLNVPCGHLPGRLPVTLAGERMILDVRRMGERTGLVMLPPSGSAGIVGSQPHA